MSFYGAQEEKEKEGPLGNEERIDNLRKAIAEYKEKEDMDKEYAYIIGGDFNAKVGKDARERLEEEGGKGEVGEGLIHDRTSKNGERMLELCMDYELTAINTKRINREGEGIHTFKGKDGSRSMLDYILIDRDRSKEWGGMRITNWKPIKKEKTDKLEREKEGGRETTGHRPIEITKGLHRRIKDKNKKKIDRGEGKKIVKYSIKEIGKYNTRRKELDRTEERIIVKDKEDKEEEEEIIGKIGENKGGEKKEREKEERKGENQIRRMREKRKRRERKREEKINRKEHLRKEMKKIIQELEEKMEKGDKEGREGEKWKKVAKKKVNKKGREIRREE